MYSLIKMILTMNNFQFENSHYLQLHGTALSTKMTPAYANLFMDDLEQKILSQSPLKPLVWWRYIDDVFMIWPHGEEKLSEFVNLNSSHETIKFTHDVSPSKINFLDVTVLLHNNSIATDLHVKSTDTHKYLLSSSCHPNHIKRSIPYCLALKLRRICSTDDSFKRTDELTNASGQSYSWHSFYTLVHKYFLRLTVMNLYGIFVTLIKNGFTRSNNWHSYH